MDLRLDLDHEKKAAPRMPRKDVDPSTGAIGADFDLGRHPPAGPTEPRFDMGGASRVSRIALSFPVAQERRIDGDNEPCTHHGE